MPHHGATVMASRKGRNGRSKAGTFTVGKGWRKTIGCRSYRLTVG